MKVTIFYNSGAAKAPKVFNFDLTEFQRLVRDYEKYIREGLPERGQYSYYAEAELTKTAALNLEFNDISLIG
jgi:hypothetical protein